MKTQGDDEDENDIDIQIEGLTDDYCDDFVCTSSPAVEQTLRSLAKDLVRRKWTPILFARDVKYNVSFHHASKGIECFRLQPMSCLVLGALLRGTTVQEYPFP